MSDQATTNIPEFICVRIDDPDEPGQFLDAIVRTSLIVKIAQRKFEVRTAGELKTRTRYYGDVAPDFSTIDADYIFTDSTGCQYLARDCDPRTRDVIASLWASYFQARR